jgi:hypothetical protein
MIVEITFWIAFVTVTRTLAKIDSRRGDVLYGPYVSQTD